MIGAIVLVVIGGLFAAIDAAINTVSIARVDELIRDERPGAVRLAKIVRNRPQYVNLVVLLRVVCEASATVVVAAAGAGSTAACSAPPARAAASTHIAIRLQREAWNFAAGTSRAPTAATAPAAAAVLALASSQSRGTLAHRPAAARLCPA